MLGPTLCKGGIGLCWGRLSKAMRRFQHRLAEVEMSGLDFSIEKEPSFPVSTTIRYYPLLLLQETASTSSLFVTANSPRGKQV